MRTEEVSESALAQAWALVTTLDPEHSSAGSPVEPSSETNQTCRALIMLSGITSGLLAAEVRARTDDPLELVAPLLRKTQLCGADSESVPILAGLLTAGLLGHDTIDWSKRHLTTISGPGKLGLLYLVWCQRSLYDHLTEDGRLDSMIDTVLLR